MVEHERGMKMTAAGGRDRHGTAVLCVTARRVEAALLPEGP
jgi:hypothetical protein